MGDRKVRPWPHRQNSQVRHVRRLQSPNNGIDHATGYSFLATRLHGILMIRGTDGGPGDWYQLLQRGLDKHRPLKPETTLTRGRHGSTEAFNTLNSYYTTVHECMGKDLRLIYLHIRKFERPARFGPSGVRNRQRRARQPARHGECEGWFGYLD